MLGLMSSIVMMLFEKDQVENELLKCLLEAYEYEKGIAGIDRRMFQVLVETEADTSLLNYGMFASIQRSVSEYITAIKALENNLLFESIFEGKDDGQTFGTVTRTENQNSILTEMDEIVSHKTLVSDQKEGNHKDEDEATVSQIEDETVLGLRKTELTDRNGQRIEGKLLKIVKTQVLEGNQVINECLKYWLKVFKKEEETVVNEDDMFLLIKET